MLVATPSFDGGAPPTPAQESEHQGKGLCGMTTIRISEVTLLPELLADIRSRRDLVADVIGVDTIRVSILGSYNRDALRMATFLRVRAWETAQRSRGVDVSVEVD
jgi:hypothetical protein